MTEQLKLTPEVAKTSVLYEHTTRELLAEWADLNTGITIEYVTREEYNEKHKGEEIKGDKLYLPFDAKFYELPGIAERIDMKTYEDDPELLQEQNKKRKELGQKILSAGVYMAKRLDSIETGKHIAEDTALDFYEWGNKLLGNEDDEIMADKEERLQGIAEIPLSDQETEEIDRFLAGKDLYEKRIKALDSVAKDEEERLIRLEQIREKALEQIFKVARRAEQIQLEKKDRKFGSPAETLTAKIQENIDDQLIGEATRDLEGAFLRKGIKNIFKSINTEFFSQAALEKFAIDLETKSDAIRDIVGLNEAIISLENIKRSGDKENVSAAEYAIMKDIAVAINSLNYSSGAAFAEEVLDKRAVNCVSATILASELLKEMGLNSTVLLEDTHLSLLTSLSNKDVHHVELVNESDNSKENKNGQIVSEKMENSQIRGVDKNGRNIRVETLGDIINGKENESQPFLYKIPNGEFSPAFKMVAMPTEKGISFALKDHQDGYSTKTLDYYLSVATGGYKPTEHKGENIQKIREAYNQNNGNVAMQKYVAEAAYVCGFYNISAELFEDVLSNATESGESELLLAMSLDKIGEEEKATEHFESALTKDLFDPEQFEDIASFYERKNDWEKAFNVYVQCEKVCGEDFGTLWHKVELAYKEGNLIKWARSSAGALAHFIRRTFENGKFNSDFVKNATYQMMENNEYKPE